MRIGRLAERDANLAERDANLAERHATLAERDAALTTERALRMTAEAGVQEVTGRRSVHPIQQASTDQYVLGQGHRNQIPPSPLLP